LRHHDFEQKWRYFLLNAFWPVKESLKYPNFINVILHQ
jgi:hypothetical protein